MNQLKTVLKKGRYNRDVFIEGDLVRVRCPKGTWDIHGEVISKRSTENGDGSLYQVKTENGKVVTRHGTYLHHKHTEKRGLKQRGSETFSQ